jgi:hypothetical protein
LERFIAVSLQKSEYPGTLSPYTPRRVETFDPRLLRSRRKVPRTISLPIEFPFDRIGGVSLLFSRVFLNRQRYPLRPCSGGLSLKAACRRHRRRWGTVTDRSRIRRRSRGDEIQHDDQGAARAHAGPEADTGPEHRRENHRPRRSSPECRTTPDYLRDHANDNAGQRFDNEIQRRIRRQIGFSAHLRRVLSGTLLQDGAMSRLRRSLRTMSETDPGPHPIAIISDTMVSAAHETLVGSLWERGHYIEL